MVLSGATEIKPATADDIGHRGFPGKLDRMPEGRDHRAGAKPHVLRAPGDVGKIDEGIGCDGEVHAVMLAGPDGVQATFVGDAAKLQHFLIEPLLVILGRDALHMDEEGKFHATLSCFRVTWPSTCEPK